MLRGARAIACGAEMLDGNVACSVAVITALPPLLTCGTVTVPEKPLVICANVAICPVETFTVEEPDTLLGCAEATAVGRLTGGVAPPPPPPPQAATNAAKERNEAAIAGRIHSPFTIK